LIIFGVCLIVLLCRGWWKSSGIRPVIFIQMPGPPLPQADTFDPFPPLHHTAPCEYDDNWD
ncbi:MAG TPA: hypothetical protein VGN61_05960, partial [Verrucomicrobiae bacterium]